MPQRRAICVSGIVSAITAYGVATHITTPMLMNKYHVPVVHLRKIPNRQCPSAPIRPRLGMVVLILLVHLALAPCGLAGTLTWDPNGSTAPNPSDGAGNWDTTSLFWWDGSNNVTWTNADGNSAVFGSGGAGGTVAVGAGTVVANITLNTNYILSGNTLTLTNTGVITAALGTSNQINSYFGGSVGWALEGGGVVNHNIGGNDQYTGTVYINNGTVWVGGNDTRQYFTGDVVVNTNGTLKYTSGGTSGGVLGGSKVLILNGGVLASATASSKYLNIQRLVLENGGSLQYLGGGIIFRTSITNVDARSGFLGHNDNRYTMPVLAKSTAGTLIITNKPYNTGIGYSNVTLNAGTVVLDKSIEKTAGKITGPLILGGGSLILSNGLGAAAGAETRITTATVSPGASSVKSLTGGTASAANGAVALTAITRQVGGTLDTETNNAYANTITTTSANNNGILGGWVTCNAADWAVGVGSSPFVIAALDAGSYQAELNPANWGAESNVTLNASTTANVGDGTNINSLRLTAASTVTLDGTLTLSSGGLLVTGSGAAAIAGGTLKGGAGADLIVHQYATSDLTISSTLADNGSASSLTKSGPGKLVISGANNLTGSNYLNAGAVEVSDVTKLAIGPLIFTGGALRYTGTDATEGRSITLNGLGGTFDVGSAGTTLTLSADIGNSDGIAVVGDADKVMGNMGGLTKTGDGTLVLTGSNHFNGLTLVAGGTLLVNGTNSFTPTTFNAGNVAVTGGVLGGTGRVSGGVLVKSGGTITAGASIGTLTLATNLTLETGAAGLFEVTNSPGTGDLLVVQGNLSIASGCAITLKIVGTPLGAGTYTLIQYSGKKSGLFSTVPVIAAGTINGSYSISDSTPGQINLVVVPDVTITGQPADIVVSTNDPATFSVTAAGEAPIEYQWYFYGPKGTEAPSPVADATNASFTIPSAQFSDSGYYGVIATNGYNSATSQLALLIVGNVLPIISGPTDATVIEGNSHTFTTRVVMANPQPALQWQTNGVDVPGASTTALTLNNIPYALDGTIVSVIASNVVGAVTNSAILTVIVPPVITPVPTNLVVNTGDTAVFYSGSTGVPAPALQWYKNGTLLAGQTDATLTIGSAQGSDIAAYYLVASNAAGVATSPTARLTVLSTTLAAVTLAPANGATGVCYDTPLYITFNGTVTNVNTGSIRIYNVTNSATPVDTLDLRLNNARGVQSRGLFPGDTQPFNYYPVMVSGSTAAIYPHPGVLTSNQTYYVTLEAGVVADSGGAYFAGIADTNTWLFTTKPAGPANPTNMFVAADGSGDFVTVQGAVDSIPLNNTAYTLINIHDGNYVGLVNISSKHNVTFRGQSRAGTVVSYPNNANIAPNGTTHARMSFKVNANDIAIENLTLLNSTPQGGSQAEALMIEGNSAATAAKRCIVNNADIVSRQDTILANINASQGYFYNSTVRGNFDYIWGGGNLFFEKCTLHTLTNTLSGTYNLTAARTDYGTTSATGNWQTPDGTKWSSNGLSFVECTLEADPGVVNITLAGNNGTAGGLSSWAFCKMDTNAYVAPSSALWTTYNFWQYENTDLLGSPISFSGLQTLTNSDPRLLAATNATVWLNGWTPALAPNILAGPVSQSVNDGQPASFTVSATGIPAPTYQWLKNGTAIVGATGATLVIPVAHVADAGTYAVAVSTPAGSATSAGATLTVTPHPNTAAPVFTAPAPGSIYTINVGANLSVTNTATDADMPAEAVTFSQLSGSGSVTADGIFTWRPQVSDAGTTNVVTIQVTDDGAPTMSATQSFSVIVNPLPQPQVSSPVWAGGQFGLVVNGQSGPDYAVQASTNLVNWQSVFATNSPAMPFQWTDPAAGSFPLRFYRIVVGPPLP